MNFIVFNAFSHDGYVLDKSKKQFVYYSRHKKAFESMLKKSDCIVVDKTQYDFLSIHDSLPKKKFIVVLTDEKTPKGLENVWFTNLDVKEVRREVKIQGYRNVLCIVNHALLQEMINTKVANELHFVIYRSVNGMGVERYTIQEILEKYKHTIRKHDQYDEVRILIKKEQAPKKKTVSTTVTA